MSLLGGIHFHHQILTGHAVSAAIIIIVILGAGVKSRALRMLGKPPCIAEPHPSFQAGLWMSSMGETATLALTRILFLAMRL